MKEIQSCYDKQRISLRKAREIWGPPRAISSEKAKEISEENRRLREYRGEIGRKLQGG